MSNNTALLQSPRALDSVQRLALASSLDEEILSLHRKRNEGLARITARLAQLKQSHGHLALGFPSVQDYAYRRLGWGSSKVKALLELQERLGSQPLIRAAFEAGELDWSKAVLASRAARHEPEREPEWLQDARELTSRELEAKVCGRTGAEPRRGRWLETTAEEAAMIDEGLRALRTEGLDLTPGAALAELVRRALQGGAAGSSRYRFLLSRCPDCERTVQHTGGEDLPVPPEVAERLLCDAEVQDTERKPTRVQSTIPPSVKNEVLARARGRCEFPGCTHRGHVELHHVEGRGKGHDPDTILLLCSGHHEAPHMGAVRIEGSWSSGFSFHRADWELIGTVGGPEADSREAPRAGGPTASREAGVVEPTASLDPQEEEVVAIKALQHLQLPERRARALVQAALAEEPALRGAVADKIALAAIRRH